MRTPFIILEGPDASGKSTLAQHITHRYGGTVLHAASMGDNPDRVGNEDIMEKYHSNLIEIALRNLASGNVVVCDRLWSSHVVYSAAKGRPCSALYETLFWDKCAELGAHYIFTLDEACILNHEKHVDPDHPYDTEMMKRVYAEYKAMFQRLVLAHPTAVTRYDYTSDGRNVPAFLEHLRTHAIL